MSCDALIFIEKPTDAVLANDVRSLRRRDLNARGFVYVLRDSEGRLHVGSSRDLVRAVKLHHQGRVPATCRSLPLRLVFFLESETYQADEAAMKGMADRGELEGVLVADRGITEMHNVLAAHALSPSDRPNDVSCETARERLIGGVVIETGKKPTLI